MNTSFTPGPWETSCVGYGSNIKPDIAWIGYGTCYPQEVHKANARLIAAAPSLYAALRNLVARGLIDTDGDHYDEAIEALNEATGQEP